ncbi:MAG: hypothetical protein Q9201_003049 [Fulgogasparrea decipioides]
MARQLNVIGFISGGKDSFFSLLHCLANGHKLLALANLAPPPHARGDNDLNSLMYQTVGYGLMPLYEEVLSIPLYRQEIRGTSVNQAKEFYAPRVPLAKDIAPPYASIEDETESMVALLHRIKMDFPEANAVCSGAILSTYQRTRIESVAVRMQMVSLAYLWQYPELPTPTPTPRKEGLLEDMAAVGLDARVVKVASGGLDEDLLLENVCAEATREKIVKAMKRFGGSVLGEGGEFETFVVDGPQFFSKGALEIKEEDGKVIRGGGGEAWMTFAGGSIKHKRMGHDKDTQWLGKLRTPDLLDGAFQRLLKVLDKETWPLPESQTCLPIIQPCSLQLDRPVSSLISVGNRTVKISNLSAMLDQNNAGVQMQTISHTLKSTLEQKVHRSIHDVVFTTILLRSMDDFQAVNGIYGELFSARPNPPARVTIACGDSLPDGVNVMISVVVSMEPIAHRQHLHVQSISYWAPANIGPYSQAVAVPLTVDEDAVIIYIAGQIPLVPASMEIATRVQENEDPTPASKLADFRLQSTLALQHMWRIGQAMRVTWWVGAIAFIVSSDDDVRHKAAITALTWQTIFIGGKDNGLTEGPVETDDASFDVWEQQRNGNRTLATEDRENMLPDLSRLSVVTADNAEAPMTYPVVPPFFAIEVSQLPRGSEIEWQALGLAQASLRLLDTIREDGISVAACSITSNERYFGFIGIEHLETDMDFITRIEQALLMLQNRCNVLDVRHGHKTIYTTHKVDMERIQAQLVPCKSVWSANGEALAAAIVAEYEVGV